MDILLRVWHPFGTPDEALASRVERLEDGLKRLERRFVRVQGEFDAVTAAYAARSTNGTDPELVKRLAALEVWAEAQGE